MLRLLKSSFFLCLCLAAALNLGAATTPEPVRSGEELLLADTPAGHYGGRLVVALRAEPKTLNPVTAQDLPSREVIGRMSGDLLHIHAITQQAQPALAKSWTVSKDGLKYTLRLRRGLRFSDGHPLDADDVQFTFRVIEDEKVNAPQHDLLVVSGKPISVRKVDAATILFELAAPYAAAERLFDSIAILPRHLLEKAYQEGKLAQAWTLNTPPSEIAGMGPFRLKEYVAGQRLVLERNPYYWKADGKKQRLPYLDELVFLFVSSEDAQVLRFQAGETDIISRLGADNYLALEKDAQARGFHLVDLGPGLEYNFLFFNLNSVVPKDSGTLLQRQEWFRDARFRQAVSMAIDRAGIVRLVYRGRGTPLWGSVTPANKLWLNTSLAQPARSVAKAKELLQSAGFKWTPEGALTDASGSAVEFSILTSASNQQRIQMATLIQADLKELGMKVQVTPLEFRAVLDRVTQTHNYEAALFALGGGDVDPNSQINVWMSNGSTHLWDLGESRPATAWEAEIDQLMKQQVSALDRKKRKKQFDRVQAIAAEQQPIITIASPSILVGAKARVGNFQPAILDHYTLWNVEQLYLK